jgi:secondary thiamine-phosphate synthase enzyme
LLLKGVDPAMIQTFQVKSSRRADFIDITHSVQEVIQMSGVREGICYIFIPHTTAAVTINENADPSVTQDIMMMLNKLIPSEDDYRHLEGNSPAHIKSSLMGCSKTVFVESGNLVLGTWQGIFFCEFDGPRSRKVCVKVVKEEGLK